MAITYDAGNNIITIVAYTEASPCTFIDIYNADKAGILSLHARTGITAADTDPVAVDRAERPADYVVLGGTSNDLYITIANWSGTTATIRITGTDRDGTAQTEDIVVTANGDYYTTKWFKTITQTQVTAFTGTSFDYDLTQGQWGVVWKQGTDQYVFDARLQIGDGTTVTYFADTLKQIIFSSTASSADAQRLIDVTANANFRLGVLVSDSDKTTNNGCSIIDQSSYNVFVVYSIESVEIYSGQFGAANSRFQVTSGSKIYNTQFITGIYLTSCSAIFYNVVIENAFYGAVSLNIESGSEKIYFHNCTYSLFLQQSVSTMVRNSSILGATVDFRSFYTTTDSFMINVDSTWLFQWLGTCTSTIYRQYDFDLKVIDKDNNNIDGATVKIWDKNRTLIVDTTTGADGTIVTQTIVRGYYNQANGNTLQDASPHLIKIEKAGYTTYEADFTLEEKVDWTIALQGVLKRNPAMTGGMV